MQPLFDVARSSIVSGSLNHGINLVAFVRRPILCVYCLETKIENIFSRWTRR